MTRSSMMLDGVEYVPKSRQVLDDDISFSDDRCVHTDECQSQYANEGFRQIRCWGNHTYVDGRRSCSGTSRCAVKWQDCPSCGKKGATFAFNTCINCLTRLMCTCGNKAESGGVYSKEPIGDGLLQCMYCAKWLKGPEVLMSSGKE